MRYHLIIIVLIALAIFAPCASTWAQEAAAADPWASFRFLLGDWSGAGSGKPGENVGESTFSFELDRNVIIRKSKAEFPPKPGEKSGAVHEDLMIIYRQPGSPAYRAIYFDNEGHVLNYTVSFPPNPQSIVFESEGSQGAPRFRLNYQLNSTGFLSVEFAIAAPGGEFKTYIKGTLKKN